MSKADITENKAFNVVITIFGAIMMAIATLTVCAIFAALLIVLYVSIKFVWNKPELIVNAFTIPIVSALILGSIGAWRAFHAFRKQKLWENKRSFYEAYLDWLFEVQNPVLSGESLDMNNEKLREAMLQYRKQLSIWGGEEFLKLYEAFQKLGQIEKDLDKEERIVLQVYLSYIYPVRLIRKELGHKDQKLLNSYLMNMFVTDAKKYEATINDKKFDSKMKLKLNKLGIEI
ncbi:hypothetical protein DRQ33_00640 [bacterium]|nr:MAG: hypothetical protein DRQ33_00640 [bacterium]